MSKDFREKLKNELQLDIAPSEAHLDQTIKMAQKAYTNRRKLRYVGTFEMIVSQFRFIARPIWFLQGIALFCVFIFLRIMMVSEEHANSLPALISVSAVVISTLALPVYGRSRRYKMREIESTTRISHSRLILAKICAVGIGDVACLMVIIVSAYGKMTAPVQDILMFILLPFLISCTSSLWILNRIGEEYAIYVTIGLCIGMGTFCWTMATKLYFSLTSLSIGFALFACALLIIVLLFECRRMMKQIPAADLRKPLTF